MVHHEGTGDAKKRSNEISHEVLGAAIEVHRALGPGLMESAYEDCLAHEFNLRGLPFERQAMVPVKYKGVCLGFGYRLDFLVGRLVVVELKAVERMDPVHESQLLTYLRLTGLWLGMLINFNVRVLKDGIRRFVN